MSAENPLRPTFEWVARSGQYSLYAAVLGQSVQLASIYYDFDSGLYSWWFKAKSGLVIGASVSPSAAVKAMRALVPAGFESEVVPDIPEQP
jgi:hypothetical protein